MIAKRWETYTYYFTFSITHIVDHDITTAR
jgi:hypothetical protein